MLGGIAGWRFRTQSSQNCAGDAATAYGSLTIPKRWLETCKIFLPHHQLDMSPEAVSACCSRITWRLCFYPIKKSIPCNLYCLTVCWFFFKEYECYNSLDPVYSCRCPPLQDCSCEVSREKCWLEIKRRVGRGERIKTMKDIDPIRGCQSDKKLGKGFKMRKKILRLGCKSPGKRRSNVVTACHVMKVPNQRHFSNYNGVGFLLQIHAH